MNTQDTLNYFKCKLAICVTAETQRKVQATVSKRANFSVPTLLPGWSQKQQTKFHVARLKVWKCMTATGQEHKGTTATGQIPLEGGNRLDAGWLFEIQQNLSRENSPFLRRKYTQYEPQDAVLLSKDSLGGHLTHTNKYPLTF